MQTVHVIRWRYHDGSGSGIVGAFRSKEDADSAMELLREHGDMNKLFEAEQVTLSD